MQILRRLTSNPLTRFGGVQSAVIAVLASNKAGNASALDNTPEQLMSSTPRELGAAKVGT